jgi:hypothetical protein
MIEQMRMLPRILSLLVIASIGLFFAGCGKDGGGSDPAEKTQLAQLSKTWTINTVTLDGVDRSDFTGFKLTVSGSFNSSSPKGPYSYSVSGTRPTPNPWPASGSWKFGSNPTHDLLRNDDGGDLAMNYTVSSSALSIQFHYTGDGFDGSRSEEVSGNWVFTFN